MSKKKIIDKDSEVYEMLCKMKEFKEKCKQGEKPWMDPGYLDVVMVLQMMNLMDSGIIEFGSEVEIPEITEDVLAKADELFEVSEEEEESNE